MNNLTQLRRSTGAARCLICGKCTSLCPLGSEGGFSARLIAAEELCEEAAGRGVGVGRCLTCAACQVRCPQGVDFTHYVRGLRELLSGSPQRPPPHGGVFQRVARAMAGGRPPARAADWAGPDLEVAEQGEVALFVGCLPFFDLYFRDSLGIRAMDIARAAVRVLNACGVKPVIVSEERCCGHDQLWSGDRETFTRLAKANAEAFAARGVKHVITACAECCRTWRSDYPDAVPGLRMKVEHLAEFLAPRLAKGGPRFRENGTATATFQDPCRLARHLGVVDAPRQVLAALPGHRIAEMDRAGKDAVCCGTSGFIHCDASSRRLQAERLASAAATGADVLVTACPKCLIHFACARAEDRRRGGAGPSLEVKDLAVLVADLLDGEGVAPQRALAAAAQGTGGTP